MEKVTFCTQNGDTLLMSYVPERGYRFIHQTDGDWEEPGRGEVTLQDLKAFHAALGDYINQEEKL